MEERTVQTSRLLKCFSNHAGVMVVGETENPASVTARKGSVCIAQYYASLLPSTHVAESDAQAATHLSVAEAAVQLDRRLFPQPLFSS